MDDESLKKYIQLHAKLKIDRQKEVKHPPIAFSIGQTTIGSNTYDCPFGTYGNFSAVIGGSKSGKSYFKSLLIASYIGGESNYLAPNIKSHRTEDLEVLDFDTEQGEWHTQMGSKRVDNIVQNSYKNYYSFMLRELDFDERLEFIEYCLNKYKKIGIVIIDGIADLISDVNSLAEANIIVQKIMEWTTTYNIHLIAILHTNWGSSKATGHLGSAVMKKAETVCQLERKEVETLVTFPFCRGFKIDPFEFFINGDGLPETQETLDY